MAYEERQEAIRSSLGSLGWLPLGARRALDVGCGAGLDLGRLIELGADPSALAGIDLLPDRAAAARARFPNLDIRTGDAAHLDFPDAWFDLVLAFTLFSSIKDQGMATAVAGEIHRVVKPSGVLLWYDFRYDNPRNPNVRGVPASAVRSLFPRFRGALRSMTLLPPLSRRLGPLTRPLYRPLSSIPPLRSHLFGLLLKDEA
jgi:SAM-dependent methyltransferase